jgi:hypothetical protein
MLRLEDCELEARLGPLSEDLSQKTKENHILKGRGNFSTILMKRVNVSFHLSQICK